MRCCPGAENVYQHPCVKGIHACGCGSEKSVFTHLQGTQIRLLNMGGKKRKETLFTGYGSFFKKMCLQSCDCSQNPKILGGEFTA